MPGNHAGQLAAGDPQDVTVEPLVDLLGAQRDEAGRLGLDIVGLEVEMVASGVVDRLDRQRERSTPGSDMNCGSPGGDVGVTPSAADQNAAALPASSFGTSIRIVDRRLRWAMRAPNHRGTTVSQGEGISHSFDRRP